MKPEPMLSTRAALPRRRWLTWATLGLPTVAAWPALTACSTPGPPPDDVRLPLDAPAGATATATAHASPSPEIWQLPRTVTLPDYLDRAQLQWPIDAVTISPASNARWAEPLREAIPRVLQRDLIACLGTPQVWLGAPPIGTRTTRRLHLQIQALDVVPTSDAVRLMARWALESTPAQPAPAVWQADLHAPMQGHSAVAAVQAHRAVLWQWARAIAQSMQG